MNLRHRGGAARADRVVAAHCHGKPGIMAALQAGVHTIEHGTWVDDEAATAMVEAGAMLVPTRFVIEEFMALDDLPEHVAREIHVIADTHLDPGNSPSASTPTSSRSTATP